MRLGSVGGGCIGSLVGFMRLGEWLDMAIEDEDHVLVVGRPGVGKTTLIRLAFSERRDYPALFIDYVGSYERYSDYYGPYPINPLEFINPHDFVDALARTINVVYGIENAMSPAMEEVILTALENLGELASPLDALTWLYTEGPRFFHSTDEANALRGARRRLNVLLNNLLFARVTHPVLGSWLNGGLKAQVGVRLRDVGLHPAIMYVTLLLTILARYGSSPNYWRFIVIDEAQYFTQGGGISPLEEAVRVGRNYRVLFIAVTQNPRAIPERLLDVFKVIVDFNKSSTPRRGRVTAYPTTPKWAGLVNPRSPIDVPVYEDWLEVDPNALSSLKRNNVNWVDCLNECGVDLSIRNQVVRGSVVRDLAGLSSCVWDCLANHSE